MDENKIDVDDTPKFTKPPLVETVMGVQFTALTGIKFDDYQQFQARTNREFAAVELQPPLGRQIETKGGVMQIPSAFLQMIPVQMILPRMWFRHPPKDGGEHLLQLQSDRLIVNWRRLPGSSEEPVYPSYKASRAEFSHYFKTLEEYIVTKKLGSLSADQCELVYTNEIKTTDYDSAAGAFGAVFGGPVPKIQPKRLVGTPENQSFNSSYWCEDLNGRFYIDAAIMVSTDTQQPVITLQLTARGTPKGKLLQGVLDWMDLAHYYVTNTFKEITAANMHAKWQEIAENA